MSLSVYHKHGENANDTSTSKTRRAAAGPDLRRLVRRVQGADRGRALGRRGGSGADDLCCMGRRRDTRASFVHGGADTAAKDSGGKEGSADGKFSTQFAEKPLGIAYLAAESTAKSAGDDPSGMISALATMIVADEKKAAQAEAQ